MTKSSAQPLADDAPHVLVVDDDRRLRELLARFLGDHGYRISVARDTLHGCGWTARRPFKELPQVR